MQVPTQDIGYWQTGNKTASSTESLHRTSTASTKTPVANWLSKSMVLPEKSSVCIVISETQLTNTVRPFWNHRRSCPACETGLLKHATISFGQQLNDNVLLAATTMAKSADLFIVMGSSLVVEPAASLPVIAKQHGACLAIINRDSTQLDSLADILIKDNIANSLEDINKLLNT